MAVVAMTVSNGNGGSNQRRLTCLRGCPRRSLFPNLRTSLSLSLFLFPMKTVIIGTEVGPTEGAEKYFHLCPLIWTRG